MIHVREARDVDIPRILMMAAIFHQEAPHFAAYPFDERKVEQLVRHAMADDEWLACVAMEETTGQMVGMGLFVAYATFFGPTRIGYDLTLFVRPTSRGGAAFMRIVRFAQEWAQRLGLAELQLSVNTGIHEERSVRAFEKLGFVRSGTILRLK